MALHLPPAVSISKFEGGYKAVSDYTDLGDTECSDALNVVYGPNGDIEQRAGMRRLYPYKLYASSATATARPITGHYNFDKLGSTGQYNVVACGDSLYNYSSSTASAIMTGLTNDSNTLWSFIQTQDPRSPSDDILLGTNGSGGSASSIVVWNGTATAVYLASFTSASGVPIAKYLLLHKERVYAANITDSADVDAGVKVTRSGFGTDGNPDPHRFRESFYVGGSSKGGSINGFKLLNDQIYIATRKSWWRFSPSSGSVGDLSQLEESVGVLAPGSLVDVGDFLIFLSERGVYVFDGNNFVHISEKVDDDIIINGNLDQLQYAKAAFNPRDNQYILYYAFGTSNRNNRALVYDLRLKCWQPPISGRQVSFASTYDDGDGKERVLLGDYYGYLYEDNKGVNDGIENGFNGSPQSGGSYTGIDIHSNTFGGWFPTSADSLIGYMIRIVDGTGVDQETIITANTSSSLSLETNWAVPPDSNSTFSIAGIDAHWRSKDYEFGNHDIVKLFRHVRVRAQEEGNINLTLHYIIDFRELANATSKDILLLDKGFAWGTSRWGQARWGRAQTIRHKISLRDTVNQPTNGTHMALRFSNRRANESFRMSGYDIELKPIGKR